MNENVAELVVAAAWRRSTATRAWNCVVAPQRATSCRTRLAATEDDWRAEYIRRSRRSSWSPIWTRLSTISIPMVRSTPTRSSPKITTKARRFLREVDSSSVGMVKCLDAFADGFEYGTGAGSAFPPTRSTPAARSGSTARSSQKWGFWGRGRIRCLATACHRRRPACCYDGSPGIRALPAISEVRSNGMNAAHAPVGIVANDFTTSAGTMSASPGGLLHWSGGGGCRLGSVGVYHLFDREQRRCWLTLPAWAFPRSASEGQSSGGEGRWRVSGAGGEILLTRSCRLQPLHLESPVCATSVSADAILDTAQAAPTLSAIIPIQKGVANCAPRNQPV